MKKILLILLLFVPQISFGAWTATENFDSYSNSDNINGLSGGSGWSGNWSLNSGTVQISNAQAQSGSLSVFSNSNSGDYDRAVSAITEGEFSLYIRKPAQNHSWCLALMNGANYRADVCFQNADIVAYYGAWSVENLVLSANANQWYKITIFLNGNNTYKVKIDNGSYTSDLAYISNGDITLFKIYEGGSAGNGAYFDSIEPPSASGGGTPEWCGVDVLSTTTPTCGILGVDPCGNVVCMATTTADITAISVTLLNALVFIVAFISIAISIWIFKLLIR